MIGDYHGPNPIAKSPNQGNKSQKYHFLECYFYQLLDTLIRVLLGRLLYQTVFE